MKQFLMLFGITFFKTMEKSLRLVTVGLIRGFQKNKIVPEHF